MRKDRRDGEAALAFDVHEEGIRGLDEAFLFVTTGLAGSAWVEQVND